MSKITKLKNFLCTNVTVVELKILCERYNLSKTGDKADIINKIIKNIHYDDIIKYYKTFTISDQVINSTEIKLQKETIPSTVRNKVWNMYIGPEDKQGNCLCCGSEIISYANFHCGHVISEKMGGEVNIHNLRPVCSQCNTSIGCKNMIEFMEKYHFEKPKNWYGIDQNIIQNIIQDNNIQNVPLTIKNAAWIKYSNNTDLIKCFMKCGSEINQKNFYCGFLIKSEDNANLLVENIRPICKTCYESIGEYDLIEYNNKFGLNIISNNNNAIVLNFNLQLGNWWGNESVYVDCECQLYKLKLYFLEVLKNNNIIDSEDLKDSRNLLCYLKITDKLNPKCEKKYNEINGKTILIGKTNLILEQNFVQIKIINNIFINIIYKPGIIQHEHKIKLIFEEIINKFAENK